MTPKGRYTRASVCESEVQFHITQPIQRIYVQSSQNKVITTVFISFFVMVGMVSLVGSHSSFLTIVGENVLKSGKNKLV